MANGRVLELGTLPHRHPAVGESLLNLRGPQAIIRLSIDPHRLPEGVARRIVTVNRRSRDEVERTEEWTIDWAGSVRCDESYLGQVSKDFGDQVISEDAAIVVMALLIHELEGVTIREVLPIGSGGDYRATAPQIGLVQVEVSGAKEDQSGHESANRLRKKSEQVLKCSDSGFVSVTTFWHGKVNGVHSYLHFVAKPKKGGKRGRRK
jgi:hypothetical protein